MKKVTAIINREKCHPNECAHECINYDPLNRSGGKGFHIGPSGKAEIDEELVIEMHKICAKMCPFHAIKIVNLPQELTYNPVHQYGKNQFRLYNIPIPKEKNVVGILGINGIGKSTAIKIIAGVLIPNCGQYDKQLNKEEFYNLLLNQFRGSEAQKYIEKLMKSEIKTSYKPQNVELIPKISKGKVKDLLFKINNNKEKFNTLIKKLSLNNILNNNIEEVSGGELQRIAIAATLLKEADLYIFDEPSSYLDIKQRMIIAKIIRELIENDKAVIVIEHDLILLDYLTDIIQILYGETSAYGVVSLPRTSREGINSFIRGYIKEENIRFRDHEIKFDIKAPIDAVETNLVTEWDNLSKNFSNFSLNIESGKIYKQEIIGILGENGLGKTTFVKLLAGVEKTDNGDIDTKIKVSYKPQYIEEIKFNTNTKVKEIVKNANDSLLIKPLQINHLLEKKFNELSGGEKQRVVICYTLSKDVDLYLLDEPSAHLDAEQRLNVAKVIKDYINIKEKTAIVVDHDLLFIDYLCNKLMVFEGIPGKEGKSNKPLTMEEGMNYFLKSVDITIRRDKDTKRPRINKKDSVKDKEQKLKNKYYYI